MDYVIPTSIASVPVAGSDAHFPVNRIYCVGRNYADHAREMGHSGREAPFFFMKPANAVLPLAPAMVGQMHYPSHTADLQHEAELVVAIGTGGSHIAAAEAMQHVWGYAVGIDMTRRDLQAEAKKFGRPWCVAKGFDESAPIGPIHQAQDCKGIEKAGIRLRVNGIERQCGTTDMMIWNIAETIEVLSGYFALQPGDLIYTGTPAGVAAVRKGDLIEAEVDGLGMIAFHLI